MYLIVGLGNPESDYSKTRHNMGFNVINKLASKYAIDINKSKFKGLFGSGIIEGEKVILLKPQTFMNLSGESVIDSGAIRIRKTGSAGSHNGMKSVINSINTENFCRVRVGIGRPQNKIDMITYVIGHIPEEEMKILDEGTDIAKDAVAEIIKNGTEIAMNKFNKKKDR